MWLVFRRKCAADRWLAAAGLEARAAPYEEVLRANAFSSIALDKQGRVEQRGAGVHDVDSLGPSLANVLSMLPRDSRQAAAMWVLSQATLP
jgi:hypothetical protein